MAVAGDPASDDSGAVLEKACLLAEIPECVVQEVVEPLRFDAGGNVAAVQLALGLVEGAQVRVRIVVAVLLEELRGRHLLLLQLDVFGRHLTEVAEAGRWFVAEPAGGLALLTQPGECGLARFPVTGSLPGLARPAPLVAIVSFSL